MKVEKVLSRFAAAPEDEGELRRLARAVGDELSRQRLEILQSFRAGLARIHRRDSRSFASGYIASLLDVVAEYEVSVRQAYDAKELQRLAVREDWREILFALEAGPRLPSELAVAAGKDRPSITRILKRLRMAGLVQAYADGSIDGRMRPHRLTLDGRRLVEMLQRQVPDGVERGIRVAVSLFHHLATHTSSSALELDALARTVLDDTEAAAAVNTWARRAKEAGLLTELSPVRPTRSSEAGPQYHLAPPHRGDADPPSTLDSRNSALWHGIPDILTQIADRRDQDVPVYVRTSTGAWGAWAYALQNRDATGMSRTIVDGDILSGTVEPPDRPFDLVYDDPEVIEIDREQPTMQAFMAQADEKFAVSSGGESVPDDFISLELTPSNKDGQ
ncbi:MAG: winged helix-turn-helix domain-containing protein [Proteobacteria bacterium]|nr:winged helix-turn-helix domain-containing protein [Pseudomonadota bacterium]